MIGIVLVAYGKLAQGFLASLEDVVGPQQQIETVSIEYRADDKKARNEIIAAIDRADTGDGVIIVTDMPNSPATMISTSLLVPNRVDVVVGLNLPMVIKLASVRDSATVSEAAEAAYAAGQKFISVASEVLSGEEGDIERTLEQRPAAFRFGLFDAKIGSIRERNEVLGNCSPLAAR